MTPRTAMDLSVASRVLRLRLTYRPGISEGEYSRNLADADCSAPPCDRKYATSIKSATIHEAKGKEYDAVCVVIPPDLESLDVPSNL